MDDHPGAAVAEAEERLRQAMLASDAAVLEELLAPDLIFTNHFGQLVTKTGDLAVNRYGALKLAALSPAERPIQVHPGFAVVSVLMHVIGRHGGNVVLKSQRN